MRCVVGLVGDVNYEYKWKIFQWAKWSQASLCPSKVCELITSDPRCWYVLWFWIVLIAYKDSKLQNHNSRLEECYQRERVLDQIVHTSNWSCSIRRPWNVSQRSSFTWLIVIVIAFPKKKNIFHSWKEGRGCGAVYSCEKINDHQQTNAQSENPSFVP